MLTFKDKRLEDILTCPICRSKMTVMREPSATLCCGGARRHSYDFSSAGYVNLSAPVQSGGGDSKQAVRARSDFLDLGYYKPICDRLCDVLNGYFSAPAEKTVLDAGCGEGYYTTAIAANGFSTVGFDISKFAAEAAAKRAKRVQLSNALFGVASVFELPIAEESVDCIVNVFAPCAEKEYTRVLKNGGILIVVCAGVDHLLGLKQAIYENIHRNEARADMPEELCKIASHRLTYDIKVNGTQNIKNLFAMTPYYWKTSPDDVKKLDSLDTLTTKIDINFEVFQKR